VAERQSADGTELVAIGVAASSFAPGHFAGILAEMRPGNVMVLADLGAAEPGEIAFRLVRASAIGAIGAVVIEPSYDATGPRMNACFWFVH
jgi:hypothetical protein